MTETSRTHPSLALHNGGGRCLGGDVCAAGGASLLGGGDRLSQLRRLVPRQRQLLWGRVRDVVVGHVVDMSWTPPAPQDSAGACRTAPTSPALASASATASALARAAARSASASRDRVCCSSASNEAALSSAAAASDAPSAATCSAALPALASSSSRSDAAACGLHVPHRHRHQVRRGGLRLLRRLQLLAGRRTCLLQRVNLRLRTCLGHVVDVSCTCLLQRTNLRLRHADRFGVRRRRRRRSLLGTAPLLGELLLSSGAGGLRGKAPAGRLREGSEKAPRRLRHALWPASLPASLR